MNQLSVVSRDITNKRVNRNLRKEGKIPAVVYGIDGTHHILVDSQEFKKKFSHYTDNTVLFLNSEGKDKLKRCVFVKDVQNDLIKDMIIHLDFYEVDPESSIQREIPVHLTGAAPGVKNGGTLSEFLKKVKIEAKPIDIPESITISLDSLNIGESIKVKDISLKKTVKILQDKEEKVVAVN